jgi:rhamnogalacturonyl hydrolase YesR
MKAIKNITSIKNIIPAAALLLVSTALAAQPRERIAPVLRKIADRIVHSTSREFVNTKTGQTYTDLKGVPFSLDVRVKSAYNDWHYTNGVLDIAMMELAGRLKDTTYSDYVWKNMQLVFNPDNLDYFRRQYEQVLKEDNGLERVSRQSWYMFFRMIRLDDYGTMAAALVDLYAIHPQADYRRYIDKAAHELEYAEPRLPDGTIARYFPHDMTVWADDLYMSVSLLARMGKLTGDTTYFDDAMHQMLDFHKYLWDSARQLYYHCWYSDTRHHGVAFWGRCNGWMMMAQADLLSVLPENYTGRRKLLAMFRQQARGIARYQSPSGLWHQLLDKPDSYLETSCSAMFTYCLARGVNRGWLEPDFAQVAYYGWKGLLTRIDDQGDVSGICPGTGIAPSLVAYYNRPERSNIAMGEGPVLRAGAEMMELKPYREKPASETYHLVKDRSKQGKK